jgi:branched-chain amino acid transport system ATP-binding protein
MLELRNIEVFYGPLQALFGVSLTVPEGGIVTILGANGSGKSTILKTIGGLLNDQPDKGSISFEGQRVDGLDTAAIIRRGVAYVPEGREVFPELTVEENLLMGAYLRRDRRGIADDIARMGERFPILRERARQFAGTLSGGEQQMLAIARGLMSRPRLLMLDEPSLGLAPTVVKEIFHVIREINAQGTTILLVEQNARVALETAEHGYVIESGRLVMDAPCEELLANEDVQEFYLGVQRDEGEGGSGKRRYKRKKRWR